MNKIDLENLLTQVKNSDIPISQAIQQLEMAAIGDLGFAQIDNHRELRVGYPEVIYGEGKTDQQVATIVEYMTTQGHNVLVTRCRQSMMDEVQKVCPHAVYNPYGKTITVINKELSQTESTIAIIAAGTSDLPVVEEAYETAKIFGNKVIKIIDVGVAGIHRLFNQLETIRSAKVIIVVAGMEGALASVVGGLVEKPIIAVPTSVGYGANLGGIAALLSMLNSCASGVSVVNIDNGFGAAYSASIINKL